MQPPRTRCGPALSIRSTRARWSNACSGRTCSAAGASAPCRPTTGPTTYDRSFAGKPVKYPVACNPQAWAAGSLPYMLASVLGLHPDAFNRRLHIRYPHLPDWLEWVTLRHLRVGEAELDLHYQRSEQRTLVAATRKHGDLLLSVES